MIKKAVFEDALIAGMQRELQAHEKKQAMTNLVKAADYLHSAMEILEDAGLTAQSDQILTILYKIARDGIEPGDVVQFESLVKEPPKKPSKEDEELVFKSLLEDDEQDARGKPRTPKDPTKINDRHTKGLTPDKMVKNLLDHGHPLNLADDAKADDLLNIEVDEKALEIIEDPLDQDSFEDEVDSTKI